MTYDEMNRAFNATMKNPIKPNHENSFRGWQKEAAAYRQAWSAAKRIYEDEAARIAHDYGRSPVGTQKLEELQNSFLKAQNAIKAKLSEELNKVVEAKRASIQKACKAPSDEDVRLLQLLAIRRNLSDNDIVRAAESLGANLVAMSSLADIAEQHGSSLPIPSADKYDAMINDAEEYSRERLAELFSDDRMMTYFGNEFFNYPDAEQSHATMHYSEVDSSPYCNGQGGSPGGIDIAALKAELKAYREAEKQKAEGVKTSLSGGDGNG